MQIPLLTSLATLLTCVCTLSPVLAQEQSSSTVHMTESSSSSVSSQQSSSSSSAHFGGGSSNNSSSSGSSSPGASTAIFSVKPSIKFLPKFKQRIIDLGDQIRLAQNKGFITADEGGKFLERQSKLLSVEAEASKKGFAKADVDDLEKAITLFNGDLFKVMHKQDPIKPSPADSEVNDPNLIPAYPDKDLQAGSGLSPDAKK